MIPGRRHPSEQFEYKLAAILSADVVGYSRLMADNELATIRTFSAYRDKISTQVHDNGGRVADFVGDNMLAEFSSALNALNCAVKIQKAFDWKQPTVARSGPNGMIER